MPVTVINTNDMARVLMVLRLTLNCLKLILKAASYNKGGRKIRKITPGLISTFGNDGIKPMPIPALMSKIGYGIFILPAIAESPIIRARINKTML